MGSNCMGYVLVGFFISICIHQVSPLECYVCIKQENNKDKCVETVKNCEIGQDRCMTEVRWGSTPYWAPSGLKQYYINKTCASREMCEQREHQLVSRCDRIWYNDWECVECCTGDRCNYYVTLAGSTPQPGLPTIILATAVALALIKW
ncbi:coiled [Brevipalpus obovatus]|uniref:coiled n=1 Tax=Brevipalpus obovatus TaxID=246614 RepID=UPI003D9E4C79